MAVEIHSREVAELLSQPYRMVIHGDDAEGYLAEAPELPGCVTAGETPAEALELLREAMALWVESAIERGLAVPSPAADQAYSGRILMRVPKTLHRRLVEQARDQGVSLNQWVNTLLAMRSATGTAQDREQARREGEDAFERRWAEMQEQARMAAAQLSSEVDRVARAAAQTLREAAGGARSAGG
jgi:antitoxin HicB